MAVQQIVICNAIRPNELRVNPCPSGQFGHLVQADVHDGVSVYGLPNIAFDDMTMIVGAVAMIWAVAWIFKQARSVF